MSGENHRDFVIRPALREDVAAIVALFAGDALGGHGDTTDPAAARDYIAAFERIEKSASDTLYVAVWGGEVVGTFQTTLVTSMPGRGATKMLLEAVHTRVDMRGRGIGAAMVHGRLRRGTREACRGEEHPAHVQRGTGGRAQVLRAARLCQEPCRL